MKTPFKQKPLSEWIQKIFKKKKARKIMDAYNEPTKERKLKVDKS